MHTGGCHKTRQAKATTVLSRSHATAEIHSRETKVGAHHEVRLGGCTRRGSMDALLFLIGHMQHRHSLGGCKKKLDRNGNEERAEPHGT